MRGRRPDAGLERRERLGELLDVERRVDLAAEGCASGEEERGEREREHRGEADRTDPAVRRGEERGRGDAVHGERAEHEQQDGSYAARSARAGARKARRRRRFAGDSIAS